MAESHVQRKLLDMMKRRIPTVIAIVLLLAVWEAWVRIGHVPSTMIASPSEIAQATVETWPTLWPATQVTLLEGTVGFLLAVACGILIGILLYCSRVANAALFPLLSAAQTMPLIFSICNSGTSICGGPAVLCPCRGWKSYLNRHRKCPSISDRASLISVRRALTDGKYRSDSCLR